VLPEAFAGLLPPGPEIETVGAVTSRVILTPLEVVLFPDESEIVAVKL